MPKIEFNTVNGYFNIFYQMHHFFDARANVFKITSEIYSILFSWRCIFHFVNVICKFKHILSNEKEVRWCNSYIFEQQNYRHILWDLLLRSIQILCSSNGCFILNSSHTRFRGIFFFYMIYVENYKNSPKQMSNTDSSPLIILHLIQFTVTRIFTKF